MLIGWNVSETRDHIFSVLWTPYTEHSLNTFLTSRLAFSLFSQMKPSVSPLPPRYPSCLTFKHCLLYSSCPLPENTPPFFALRLKPGASPDGHRNHGFWGRSATEHLSFLASLHTVCAWTRWMISSTPMSWPSLVKLYLAYKLTLLTLLCMFCYFFWLTFLADSS